MRHFLTAGLTLAAASTVAAAPAAASAPPANGDPATLNYAVANFYAYWSLGHVLEAAFEIKEKDTDKFVAYCTGKVPSSISPPPDNQPSSLGNCVSLDRESTISATVGGDPGTNLLIYVKDDKSIPCGPQTQYEGTTSVSAASYYCQNLEQNGNSAQCNQKKDAAIDLIMNKAQGADWDTFGLAARFGVFKNHEHNFFQNGNTVACPLHSRSFLRDHVVANISIRKSTRLTIDECSQSSTITGCSLGSQTAFTNGEQKF
ncbi:hypothetical protein IWX50DRAFT_618220 [Phyllosticta citricarpa]